MVADRDRARHWVAIRAWTARDRDVDRAVRRVPADHLDFARKAFRELGFGGVDLDMRGRLFVVYHSWEGVMFGDVTARERTRRNEAELDLLTRRGDEEGNS
jgi:hypothetical protein